MVCSITCTISSIFIIGMIYFYNASYRSKAGEIYKNQLNQRQQLAYDRIVKERLGISLKGYFFRSGHLALYHFIKLQTNETESIRFIIYGVFSVSRLFYHELFLLHLKPEIGLDVESRGE